MKQAINKDYQQKIINLITALHPKVKIFLFGSQATGTQVHGSDIDIALDAEKPMNRAEVGEVREILNATDIPYKIDVVDFHSVPEAMQKMILKEGIVWKS
jgi:predicted nucleotidyltransferase